LFPPTAAQELLKRGAVVGTCDGVGRSTLHKAANAGDINVIKLLAGKAHGERSITPLSVL
jgi:hypothetical protein